MREKIKMVCCSCLVLILLPFVTTVFFQGIEGVPLVRPQESMIELAQQENSQASQSEEGEKDGTAVQLEQLNYILVGILANQISSDEPEEAVKAQAVVARTEYYYARKQGQEIPQGRSEEEMHQIWPESEYDRNYTFLMDMVKETAGQVLTSGGRPINAAYHAVSNGRTRTMGESTSQEGYDYLKSVECPRDIESEDYLTVEYYEPEDLAAELVEALPDCRIEAAKAASQIAIQERDQEDYVTKVQVGEQSISGDSFREILKLPSDCFYLEETEGKVRIVTKGLGHGLGLSQYTASVMAEEGADHKKILEYFYSGAELTENYVSFTENE